MIEIIKTIRDVLIADATIKSYCGDPARIYIVSKPVLDTASTSYPQITLTMEDGGSDTVTNVNIDATFTIHIWTKTVSGVSGGYTTGNLIAKRIYELIDIKNFESVTPKVYKIWRTNSLTIFEDETQVFHTIINFNCASDGYFDPEA